ncbi:hypothetical protein P280DRAFT_221372 [Massarina eburnea CBS 473.64]|uniref:Uncharacterized protein n=1 Tax=Massarina eburnea CBS 473.64 TaxID=1395130 RepID=A0A6A6SAZ4_9PLEO|nr:hypothetical protein P280DRAFT_221372 [Massarina eburnea CBS 473.64]
MTLFFCQSIIAFVRGERAFNFQLYTHTTTTSYFTHPQQYLKTLFSTTACIRLYGHLTSHMHNPSPFINPTRQTKPTKTKPKPKKKTHFFFTFLCLNLNARPNTPTYPPHTYAHHPHTYIELSTRHATPRNKQFHVTSTVSYRDTFTPDTNNDVVSISKSMPTPNPRPRSRPLLTNPPLPPST